MNVQDVDLNLLRVFDAVLHEKGVTPAALRLGLTQPAVSNALRRGCASSSAIRFSCARRAASTRRRLRASWPSRCARRSRCSNRRLRTGRASTPRVRRALSASTCPTSARSSFCSTRRAATPRRARGVRLEAVALEVDDIGNALATGALDVAIGFLPAGARRCGARLSSAIPTSASCAPTTRSPL